MMREENSDKNNSLDMYKSYNVDHLGLVSSMFDELGIGDLIDRAIIQDTNKRIVSIGQAVKSMVLNGLGFANKSLYLVSHFFQDKPVEALIGKGIDYSNLNDDLLGRTLDIIYEYGVSKLYSLIAVTAIKRLDLLCNVGHLDSTSFHLDGDYSGQSDSDINVIHITKGYSRDHRPDLNQVVLQLISDNKSGIPLLMEVLSGNNSDKTSFRLTIENHISNLKKDFGLEYIVSDSAMYTSDTLKELNYFYWISRVPETINIAKELIQRTSNNLNENQEEMSYCSIGVIYAGIKQRWLIISSKSSYDRALKTFNKNTFKQTQLDYDNFNKLCSIEFYCEKDAEKAFKEFEIKIKQTVVNERVIVKIPCYESSGRPSKNTNPEKYIYKIRGNIASITTNRHLKVKEKSCFIVATNQLEQDILSDIEVIKKYKEQQKVERGFRFMKDPMFMASTLYLKSPKRIMALMMILTVCLMVYSALEYRIRKELKEKNETFPDQKNTPIQNPSCRWVFQFFKGIHLLVIGKNNNIFLNINQNHRELLKLLGSNYESFYSTS